MGFDDIFRMPDNTKYMGDKMDKWDYTKGELSDRCKQLEAVNKDLYEACKEMMERFNHGTRFPLQSTCDKMNQAIARVEGIK